MNLKKGWYVDKVETNKEKGSLNEFIEKEGKWFNYIRGENIFLNPDSSIHLENDGYSTWDQDSFAIQGLGALNGAPSLATVLGCIDPTATNYLCASGNMPPCTDSPNLDDGSCYYSDPVPGCTTLGGTAVNNDCISGNTSYPCGDNVTTDDGSCLWIGCTNPLATNYASTYGGTFPAEAVAYNVNYPGAIFDDGSCVLPVSGCTDNTMFNYDPTATVDDGSCVPFIDGCLGQNNILATQASNYNIPPGVNTDDGSCAWDFCNNPLDANYNALAVTESAGYFPQNNVNTNDCISGGCTDPTATNYSVDANGDPINTLGNAITWDDGSCIPVSFNCVMPGFPCNDPGDGTGTFSVANGHANPAGDCASSCVVVLAGCTWSGPNTDYTGWGSAVPNAGGNYPPGYNYAQVYSSNTPQNAAVNYSAAYNQEDGNCQFLPTVYGCTDPTAPNYDASATIDDNSCIYCTGFTHTVDSVTQPSAPGATDGSIVVTINSQYPLSGNVQDISFGMAPSVGIVSGDISAVYTNGNQTVTITVANIGEVGSFNLAFYDDINFPNAGCEMMNADYNFPPVAVGGCTDPNDYYYDANAAVDNGTCDQCWAGVDPATAVTWDATDASNLVYSQYPCDIIVSYGGNYYQNVFCANISGTDYNLTPGTYGSIWLPCDQPTTPSCDLNNLANVNNSSNWAPMQQMQYVTGDVVLYNNYYYVATFDLTGPMNPDSYQYIPGSYYAGVGGGGSPWVLCLSTTN